MVLCKSDMVDGKSEINVEMAKQKCEKLGLQLLITSACMEDKDTLLKKIDTVFERELEAQDKTPAFFKVRGEQRDKDILTEKQLRAQKDKNQSASGCCGGGGG